MANYKLNEQMVSEMSEGDKTTLLSLYLHRCLTPSMITNYLYSCDRIPQEVANHRLDAMILDKLVEAISYGGEEEAIFLTPLGIRTVISLYGVKLKGLYKPGSKSEKLPTYCDLKMCHANINHQIHLNKFGLEFEAYARGVVEYAYFDEKFMPPASDFMMPDGMIVLPDRLIFLEMDMGTEAAKRLAQKWNSYRMFLNSPKAYYENKPITMLFLLDGIAKKQLRQRTTMRSMMKYLGSRVNGNFEAYFETPERCHEILKTKYISVSTELSALENESLVDLRSRHGFSIFRPPFLQGLRRPQAYYIKRIDENGNLIIVGSRQQEFILELWLDHRFSVYQNLTNHDQFKIELNKYAHREVPYLLVVPSIAWANRIPQITKSPIPDDVFFTTPERLKNNSKWSEALFQIDQIKNLVHYQDDSLRMAVHEKRLTKL